MHFNYHQLSNDAVLKIKKARWKARTDLLFLCNEILGYRDVTREVHGNIIDTLQQFPKPNEKQFWENDDLSTGVVKYKPIIPMTKLVEIEPFKRRLILDPRGWYKTSVNAIAHTIQWIINYPNVGILIVQSNIEKAEEILAEIKTKSFVDGKIFRELFPEHVPHKKIYDWGTKGRIVTEAADPNNPDLGATYHKEGTVLAGGIDKGLSGKHLDVIKFSDIVDPTNTKTVSACEETRKSYFLAENLLTAMDYWIDIEGTRYSHADLYGFIIKDQMRLPIEKRRWKMHVRGCYKKKTPDGKPQRFIPDELSYEDLSVKEEITEENPLGKVSWFPKKAPVNILEEKRRIAPYEFSTQQYNYPQSAEEGMKPFPLNLMKLLTRKTFTDQIPKSYYEISIDTAETDGIKSNYTSMAVGCWTGNGNCVIVEIVHGKFLPDILIDKMYDLYKKYKPRNVKIEETSFTRGLMAGIKFKGSRLGINLPIQMIKRDNQTAKVERIINTLQPWYRSGALRFVDDIECMSMLKEELDEFPTCSHDDILDSLADLFQGKEYFGRETVREEDILMANRDRASKLHQEYLMLVPKMQEMFLDFRDETGRNYSSNSLIPSSYDRTGGL